MISVPIKLDADTKKKVIEAYTSILSDVSLVELRYVASKLPRVYKRLSKNKDEWTSILASYSRSMFSEVKIMHGNVLSEEGKYVTAALFYLCEPVDIIPDYTPGIGYVDDAIVVNQSLRDIKKMNSDLYLKIIESVTKY